jgi:copper chaperone CopZ
MIQRYRITGMTCNDCCKLVEEKLNAMPLVRGAIISIEKSETLIETENYISINVFQKALPSKYTISKIGDDDTIVEFSEKSELKQLYPLFLILAYILIGSILLNSSPWNAYEFILDFLGVFYFVFSLFKLLDLKNFPKTFKLYDPLAKVFPVYGWLYPFIELVLGFMFLMRIEISIALIVTLVILGTTTIGVIKALLDKKIIRCACLGTVLKFPLTKVTLIENSIIIVLVIIMLLKIS